MSRVIQISVIGRVFGNVNADEVVGQRITLKKMYSSKGEVFPFISARAIKRAIRIALKDMGYSIDEFIHERKEALELSDSGRPDKFIDNDLFGYMYTLGKRKQAISRQAPVAISYFKALRDTPIKTEIGGRFPWKREQNPVPFEVEVADFIGKLNCIMYDYIGDFREEAKHNDKIKKSFLENDVRKDRIKAFLKIFLTPTYVLPRRTNSLNIPEYIGGLLAFSKKGPIPIFQYYDYDFNDDKVDVGVLNKMTEVLQLYDESDISLYYINYKEVELKMPDYIKIRPLDKVIEEAANFLVSEEQ